MGQIKPKKTDAMVVGSAVDTWLTAGYESFASKYTTVGRRSKSKDGDEGEKENGNGNNWEYQLNPTMLNQVSRLCEYMEEQSILNDLRNNYKSQDILWWDSPGGFCEGLCGIPDWYRVNGKKCILVDLKTTSNLERVKYHYHCVDYGYYRQLAMYMFLLKERYKSITEFRLYHLVLETGDNLRSVLYDVTDNVDVSLWDFKKILYFISGYHFEKPNISWDKAIKL
jgi:hypothetical protein